jgi:hypothetical protein
MRNDSKVSMRTGPCPLSAHPEYVAGIDGSWSETPSVFQLPVGLVNVCLVRVFSTKLASVRA